MKKIMKIDFKNKANEVIQDILKSVYFDYIPIGEIDEGLQNIGVVMLQEDNTEYADVILGNKGSVSIKLASVDSAIGPKNNAIPVYTPYDNTLLLMNWCRMSSGKIKVIGYVF